MDFIIYTFGDVEVFRAALAGVAMVFDGSGFFVGEGGLGLGALAGLGLLIGLIVMLIQGVIDQRVQLGGFIMAMVLFVILFVPKFSVNVEDYNGGAIAKVDDVPLGVAMPAALVSGLAREMNIRMGTAFSTVDGYPSGLNTPGALTSPLKMLFALRYAAPHARDQITREMSNLQNLVAYCVAGRDNNHTTWLSGRISDNQIEVIIAQAAEAKGLTMYAVRGAPNASLHSCGKAAEWMKEDIDAFMEPTGKSAAVMTAAAATKGAAPVKIINNKAMIEPITTETQDEALKMLFQASSNDAYNFMKMAMFMPSVNKALDCAGPSGDPADWARCIPFQQATVQFSEDAAAAGTFFQRLMFHGMNALFFIWICLSPVVAMMMLIIGGMKGMKLAGSYLMFGAWAVSWYVGASIVNFYMLKQVQYEVAMLGQIGGLTQAGIGQFFDVLQNKIAVSGDMMASVPLIMMTVMTGSVYGMTQLASRWGAKDYYDEKVNSPDVLGAAPMHQRMAASSNIYGRQGFDMAGYRDAGSIDLSSGLSHQVSDSRASLSQQSTTLQAAFHRDLTHSVQTGTTAEQGRTLVDRLASSGMHRTAAIESLAQKVMNNDQLSTDRRQEIAGAIRTSAGVSTGLLGKAVGVSADVTMEAALKHAAGTTLSQTESKAVEAISNSSSDYQSALANERSADNISRFMQSASESNSATDSTSWTRTASALQSYSTTHASADALTEQQSMAQRTNLRDLARGLGSVESVPAWTAAIDSAHNKLEYHPGYIAELNARRAALETTDIQGYDSHALARIAELQAIHRVSPTEFSVIAGTIMGTHGLTAPTGEHLKLDVGAAAEASKVAGFSGRDPVASAAGIMKTVSPIAGNRGAVVAHNAEQRAVVDAHQKPGQKPDIERLRARVGKGQTDANH